MPLGIQIPSQKVRLDPPNPSKLHNSVEHITFSEGMLIHRNGWSALGHVCTNLVRVSIAEPNQSLTIVACPLGPSQGPHLLLARLLIAVIAEFLPHIQLMSCPKLLPPQEALGDLRSRDASCRVVPRSVPRNVVQGQHWQGRDLESSLVSPRDSCSDGESSHTVFRTTKAGALFGRCSELITPNALLKK